ncbi:low-specificity L-threonine aldolase [Flavisolibacter ginsenosidimutans]|uniref:Low-specificity L-threonine aldolase n=1 Tax=Flavisolibacter ginsenosidimutans TaxID=661481 RepID=A0A5B8UFB7_9BACT|nr:low-specificity L-threonine aldolase [Flavisolibacter ginsenosidimutans]QEC55347.1 low-specificity L-threonine aldolase [Flavisolibacter ginsenosidimutans]
MIDYRSDTVTKPSKAMLEAMFSAPVGDDVFGEDPSINELENLAATMFGMEAALFCPSGTMTNQIAIKCHTQPGDEVICDVTSHIYQYEGGGIAANSGSQVKLIQGDRGRITAEQVRESINADDVHKARTTLVSLENTSNRGGGSCYDLAEIKKIRSVCDEHGLALHLDGARLFNALVAKGESAEDYGKTFHSISICLSKSLGCPVGSLVMGTKDFIRKARRARKAFGGGMRQAGYLAAAGIYALKNNIERLTEDHQHAKLLAEALSKKNFVETVLPVETNIVIFSVRGQFTPQSLVAKLKEQNIYWYAISPTQVRIVTHLDVTQNMIEKTIDAINDL